MFFQSHLKDDETVLLIPQDFEILKDSISKSLGLENAFRIEKFDKQRFLINVYDSYMKAIGIKFA